MKTQSAQRFKLAVIPLFLILSILFCLNLPVQAINNTQQIQILGTSDIHGMMSTWDYCSNSEQKLGSLTQIFYQVKKLRSENPNTLFCDLGDSIQGNAADIFLNEAKHPMFLAMEKMGYDTWVYGNHEFNYGSNYVKSISGQFSKTQVLCANIYTDTGERLAKPYFVKNINGVRVALIGLTVPHVTTWDGAKLIGWRTTSPVDEAKVIIKKIKDNNEADVIIACTHMRLDKEYSYGDNATDLANACPEIDAIICGHAHQTIESKTINGVLITEPGKNGQFISKIDLEVQKNQDRVKVIAKKSTLVPVKNSPVDQELAKMLEPYHKKAVNYSETVIGEINDDLVPETEIEGIVQTQVEDTALPHLINEVQMDYVKKLIPENARLVSVTEVFMPNSNLKKGKIRNCDLVSIYKCENNLGVMKISGKKLKEYVEYAGGYYNQYKPGDLTVSFNRVIYDRCLFDGIYYEIDVSQPEGNRIRNLRYLDGTEIQDDDVVYVVSCTYELNISYGKGVNKGLPFEMVFSSENEPVSDLRQMIKEYIVNIKHGQISNRFIQNWKIIGTDFDLEKRELLKQLVRERKIVIPSQNDGKFLNTASITEKELTEKINQ